MRAADIATVVRMLLAAAVAYLVVVKYNVLVTIAVFAAVIVLDAVDGYLAVWQESKYRFSFAAYVRATLLNNRMERSRVSRLKHASSGRARFGPRIDIAGDRFVEYTMWIVFTFLGIVPLFILIAIVFRHSVTDALMGARGTSSSMRTKFARALYTSNASRAAINLLKILTFGYLILMYVLGYPALIGYALIGLLFVFVMLRGAAEIYESVA